MSVSPVPDHAHGVYVAELSRYLRFLPRSSLGFGVGLPELEEVIPLERLLQGIAFDERREIQNIGFQGLGPIEPWKDDVIGEFMDIQPIVVSIAQTKEAVDRAIEQGGNHVRPHGKRRRPPEEGDSQDMLMAGDGHAVAGDDYPPPCFDLLLKRDRRFRPELGNLQHVHVIRRIFEAFALGKSPLAIAKVLNAEGVPGPQGRPWQDTAIRGHAERGTGILRNELYVGRRSGTGCATSPGR